MNPETGEIRKFESEELARAAGFTVAVKSQGKSSCRKCYGRGHIGRNDRGRYVECSCVKLQRRRNAQTP